MPQAMNEELLSWAGARPNQVAIAPDNGVCDSYFRSRVQRVRIISYSDQKELANSNFAHVIFSTPGGEFGLTRRAVGQWGMEKVHMLQFTPNFNVLSYANEVCEFEFEREFYLSGLWNLILESGLAVCQLPLEQSGRQAWIVLVVRALESAEFIAENAAADVFIFLFSRLSGEREPPFQTCMFMGHYNEYSSHDHAMCLWHAMIVQTTSRWTLQLSPYLESMCFAHAEGKKWNEKPSQIISILFDHGTRNNCIQAEHQGDYYHEYQW